MFAVTSIETELADQSSNMLALWMDAHIDHRIAFMAFNEAFGSNGPLDLMEDFEWFLLFFSGRNDSRQGLCIGEFLTLMH